MAFADPMNTPGLMLSPSMTEGFRFVIMKVRRTNARQLGFRVTLQASLSVNQSRWRLVSQARSSSKGLPIV
jgi:fructose 1,6-bisphosphatase